MAIANFLRFAFLAVAVLLLAGQLLANSYSITNLLFFDNQAGYAALVACAGSAASFVYSSLKRRNAR